MDSEATVSRHQQIKATMATERTMLDILAMEAYLTQHSEFEEVVIVIVNVKAAGVHRRGILIDVLGIFSVSVILIASFESVDANAAKLSIC